MLGLRLIQVSKGAPGLPSTSHIYEVRFGNNTDGYDISKIVTFYCLWNTFKIEVKMQRFRGMLDIQEMH